MVILDPHLGGEDQDLPKDMILIGTPIGAIPGRPRGGGRDHRTGGIGHIIIVGTDPHPDLRDPGPR